MKKQIINIKTILLTIVSLVFFGQIQAQTLTQTIRGKIVDQDSKMELIGAEIIILNTSPVLGAATDLSGEFRIDNVPVGRVDLKISSIGYEERMMHNILVGSGKEVVLNIELVESILELGGAEIIAEKKGEVLNEMAIISARSVSVEETSRYAGSFDDPARMVSAFAGVNGDAEGDNDIVVRGNSPKGILWRLEGVDIPNPNHFASEGSTGGPINALNGAMLDNSDFYSGAFSSDYGNALSGVFDIKLRTGNNENREYSASLSVMGVDLTVEGPFSSNYKGSYLANYRYSTLSILDDAGIVDFGGVPKYQDASFKVKLPIGDKNIVTLFGLGGISSISQNESKESDENIVLWESIYGAKLGVVGLSHTNYMNDNMYLTTILSAQGTEEGYDYNEPDDAGQMSLYEDARFINTNLKAASTLNYKFNAQHKLKIGAIYTKRGFDLKSRTINELNNVMSPSFQASGNTDMIQAFTTWKYRISEDMTMVSGLHYLQFALNKSSSLEPRLGLHWKRGKGQTFTLGLGMHSKVESVSTYMAEQYQEDGSFTRPNQNLDMSKAAHFVLGYDKMINANVHFKVEAYYQHLYNVPIEDKEESTLSMLNTSEWYTNKTLVNEGKGKNYGLEFTLERYFNNGFYYMSTLSLYKSLYTAKDGIERNTVFDGNYVANLLGGKEFKVGKPEKNKTLFINTKVALIGGSRYTPVNLEAAQNGGEQFDDSNPFSKKGDDIFKLDIGFGLRRDRKTTTTEFKVELLNATNNDAILYEYYNDTTEEIEHGKQLPMIPNIIYRISF